MLENSMEKLSNTIVTVIPARQTLRDKIRSLQIFELKKKHVKRVFKSGIVGVICFMQYGGRISVGFRQNGDEQIRLQRDGLRSDVRPLAITLILLSQCVFRGANFVEGLNLWEQVHPQGRKLFLGSEFRGSLYRL